MEGVQKNILLLKEIEPREEYLTSHFSSSWVSLLCGSHVITQDKKHEKNTLSNQHHREPQQCHVKDADEIRILKNWKISCKAYITKIILRNNELEWLINVENETQKKTIE